MHEKPIKHYDALVIGAGQAGVPLARELARAGMKTALIEREYVGGTCINVGCTPTKTMVASARVAYLAQRGADYGVRTGNLTLDLKKVRQRKRAIVNSFRNGSQKRLEKTANLELIFGEVGFTGAKSLRIQMKQGGELQVSADQIFVNAGCRPAIPKIDGLDKVPYLDSTSIMELGKVPKHLLVIGGGYVGLEFGQMFRRFGSRVTIMQSGKRLLSNEDPDVAKAVEAILREDGVQVLLKTKATLLRKVSGGIALTVAMNGKKKVVKGSHLLVATGRVPNTEALNLSAAGIATEERGFIQVNDRLETNLKGVFALGDIKGGPAFTHISYDDYRVIRTNLVEKGKATIKGRLVPYTVFIDPQLGRIGISETEARKTGKKVRVAKMPMSYVARALELDESRGFLKVIVDAKTDQMLGAAILGIEGGEIMSQIQLAMMGKLPYTVLKDAVFAHPTLAESLNNLFSHFEAE